MSVETPPELPHHPSASPFNVPQQSYLQAHPSPNYSYLATGALVFTKPSSNSNTARILLIQRAAGDSMPNLWETPGGGCDDEDPTVLHSVARELREESGLTATYIGAPVGEPWLFHSRSGKRICKFNFVVEVKSTEEVRLDPEEHQRFLWASEKEIRDGRVEEGGVELVFTTRQTRATILEGFEMVRGGE